jgi:hypothetical protein
MTLTEYQSIQRGPNFAADCQELVAPFTGAELPQVALGLLVQTGGTLNIKTAAGNDRSLNVQDGTWLPVAVRAVNAGTTCAGIIAVF